MSCAYWAVVPGYYLVCYNANDIIDRTTDAVVPGYYLVCYNSFYFCTISFIAVVPGYYLVCYNLIEHGRTNQRL